MLAAEGSLAGDSAPQKPSEQGLNRACESCRLSKVRCLIDAGSSICQRCAKGKRTCVFVAPQKRKQRKRTDVRVAELEREIRQMRALLKASRISTTVEENDELDDTNSDDQDTTETPPDLSPDPSAEKISLLTHTPWVSDGRHFQDQSSEPSEPDIVSRGIISMEMADEFLDMYRDKLCDYSPGTLISTDCTASEIRRSKPVLFLSIMAAASQSKGAELSERILEETLKVYADRMFIKGEKSLEFVQALMTTINYYTALGSPARLQFYQYSNMAATMALEIGIASKPRTHNQLPVRHGGILHPVSSPDGLLENCRTILLCYLLTSGLAMRLRRPNILSFNSWMAECMILLETSPTLFDKRICAWVRLQRIADESATAFGFEDASTSFTLTELRVQVVLREFERKMDVWMKTTPPEIMNLSMRLCYDANIITIWDFAIDEGKHDAPNFRNKYFTLPTLDRTPNQVYDSKPLKSLQINATLKCMGAAQSILDGFLSLSAEELRIVPNMFYVRVTCALIMLMKADYALGANQVGLGELLDEQRLKLDYYLSSLPSHVAEAIGPQRCRGKLTIVGVDLKVLKADFSLVPTHWLDVLKTNILPWHEEYKKIRPSPLVCSHPAAEQHATETSPNEAAARIASPTAAFVAFPGHSRSLYIPVSDAASSYGISEGRNLTSFSNTPVSLDQTSYDHSTWGIPANESAFAVDVPALPADMSTLFEQGDLYFWNDAMDLSGALMPPGNDFDSLQFQYPPQGS